MKDKIKYFKESVKLVWESAPGWAVANILISVLRSILPLVLIWLIKVLVDGITEAVNTGASVQDTKIIWYIVLVVIIWFADEVISDFSNVVRKKQSMKLEGYMYGLLHSKAVKLDLINFEHPEYYDLLSRASREAPWRPNNILNNIVSFFRGFLSLVLMAGLLTVLHWSMALILIAVNIPAIWLRLHYADVLYNFNRSQTPEARKAAYFNWLLTGDRPSREIRLFGLGRYFISLFNQAFLKTKEEEINIIRKRTRIELYSNLFKAVAVLLILLFITRKTVTGSLTLGQMAMFLLAFRQGMVYIKDLFSSLAGLYEDALFIGDTFEFLSLKETVCSREPVTSAFDLKNRITVENLTFTYPGNETRTIDNISFEVRKGEIIALVGPNGAGKSTLIRLLCRLYDPDNGTIGYDDINIRNIDPEDYRKRFSVVFQDFMLYNMEAGENIRLGNVELHDQKEKIISSAATAGIHDLISNLPEGYSTIIGNLFDGSRELSWGEWQKIALARALFRDSSVLILDEPSSMLDANAEHEIFCRFREIVRGRTAILISHRFTNVSLADRIIVLDRGKIVESGNHSELMQKKGIYYSMYSSQSSRFER